MKTNPLIGKTITAIEIAADKKAIRFVLSDGEEIAKADGDCCSDTWIEHIELPALGFPAEVTEVQNLDLGERKDGEWGDVTALYGCKIITTRGEIVIDYRNASNGYYGGNLSWSNDSYFYGGVYGQNVSKNEWQPVTAGSR